MYDTSESFHLKMGLLIVAHFEKKTFRWVIHICSSFYLWKSTVTNKTSYSPESFLEHGELWLASQKHMTLLTGVSWWLCWKCDFSLKKSQQTLSLLLSYNDIHNTVMPMKLNTTFNLFSCLDFRVSCVALVQVTSQVTTYWLFNRLKVDKTSSCNWPAIFSPSYEFINWFS